NIVTTINNLLAEFKLLNKVLVLTTDNEFAIVVCEQLLANDLQKELNNQTFHYYKCNRYILNLAACHRLEIIDQEVINTHTIMLKIKISTRLCDELRKLYIVQKLEYLKPELDIKMR
ncbi:10519_t:CDS:1, partial [Racocetra persica]